MDKLEPVIRHRFWILLGLCLGLSIFGFFKAQGAVVAATEAREKVLKDKFGGISDGKSPNPDYQENLAVINKDYDKAISDAVKDLYDLQKSRMVWPERVAAEIPKEHRSATPIENPTKVKYEKEYSRIITELWKKVEPVVPKEVVGGAVVRPRSKVKTRRKTDDSHLLEPVTWTQKVYCDREAIPQKFLPKLPSAESIWDAQEDVWFVELLFEAIREVNRNADSPLSAVVRKVNVLELVGGSGDTSMEGGAEAAGGTDEGMAAMKSAMMSNYSARGGESEGGMLGGGAGGYTAAVEFDPAEEFGSADVAVETSSETADEGGGGLSGGMSPYGDMSAEAPSLRWYDLKEDVPYRERGFYLSVIMLQSNIPDFMVALTSSDWPIRVVRFQMGPNPYAKEGGGATPGYGMPALAGAEQEGMGGLAGMRGGLGSSAMASARMSSMASMASRGGMSSMSGMAGMMMGGRGRRARQSGAEMAFIGTAADPFAGSLNSSELVQVDIAGIITFYVMPKEDGTSSVETPAVDTPAAPAAEETTLETEAEMADPAATDPATTDPAATDPAATPGEEATPATTPPADGTEQPVPTETPATPATETPAEPPATPPAESPPATTGDAPPAEAPAANETPPAGDSPQPPN